MYFQRCKSGCKCLDISNCNTYWLKIQLPVSLRHFTYICYYLYIHFVLLFIRYTYVYYCLYFKLLYITVQKINNLVFFWEKSTKHLKREIENLRDFIWSRFSNAMIYRRFSNWNDNDGMLAIYLFNFFLLSKINRFPLSYNIATNTFGA